jgi:hypothetical protein
MIKTPIPPGIEKRILCARFYDSIKVFYEDPENQHRFEEWQSKRKNPNNLLKINTESNQKIGGENKCTANLKS